MTMDADTPDTEKWTPERRRKHVLDAAEQCFCKYGFHSASMAQIAQAANMSVGHIYRYLPNKEALIGAIFQRDAAVALANVEALENDPRPIRQALQDYARRTIDRLTEPSRATLYLEMMAEASRNPAVAQVIRDRFAEVQSRMVALLLKARPEGCSEPEMRERIQVLDLLFAGICMKMVKSPDFDREPLAALVTDCIAKMVECAMPETAAVGG
jgi:TetR/AcrR family transcriptional regulator, repressor for uid operon